MKTKLFFILTLFIFVSASLSALSGPRIVDNAGLLSQDEKSNLTRIIDSVSEKYQFDLVIVTEKSTGGNSVKAFADDFFDYNGYGFGTEADGCLFLLSMENRDYAFSATGRGIKILNGTAHDKIENDMLKLLAGNNYYRAFTVYVSVWEEFLELEAKGRSYNFFHHYNLIITAVAWVIALVIGFCIVSFWKKAMNTALPATQAAAYVVPGSLSFTEKKDRFLYSTVTKTRRQTQSSGGGRTGSSGRSHSGRSGKF